MNKSFFVAMAKDIAEELYPNSEECRSEFVSLSLLIEKVLINEFLDEERCLKTAKLIIVRLIRRRDRDYRKLLMKLFREANRKKLEAELQEAKDILFLLYILKNTKLFESTPVENAFNYKFEN